MRKYNFITKKFLIKEYIKNKKSQAKIAKKLKVSQSTISVYMIKYNIPRRTLSEARKKFKGKDAPNYIDARTSTKHYCIEPNCNNEIGYKSWLYGNKRCKSCANKELFKNPENAPFRGKYHTKETKREMSLSHGGTGTPYENNEYSEEFFRIRPKILKRDNHTCQKCFECGNEVHHIDYDKENNNENNLITLCHKCNIRANFNRDYWFAYYTYIIEEKLKWE